MITKAASIFVIAVTSLTISRMLFDLHALKPLLAGLENMKFNTALCLLLSGIALFILNQQRTDKSGRIISQIFSFTVLLIVLLTLLEYLSGWNIGVDNFFYQHSATGNTTLYPGRMPAATAVFLLLFNISLLLMRYRKLHFFIHTLLIAGIVFLILMFLGIVLRLSIDNTTAVLSKMFVNSVFVFLMLFTAAFYSYPLSHLKFSFQKKLLGVFGMVCLSLAILFLSFISSNKRAAESARWVEQSNEVLLVSEKIQAFMGGIQAGIRGFFLTRDEDYLPMFKNGSDSINLAIDQLRLLVKDNPEQYKRIDTLENLIGKYVGNRTELLNQMKAQAIFSQPSKAAIDDGKEMMDKARRIMLTIQQQQEKLLVKRKEDNKQRLEMTKRSIILFFIIIGLLLFAAFMVVINNTRKRNKAEAALRKSEHFIRAIINNTNNPITIRDLSGRYLLVNKPAAKLFNREEAEIIGKSPYDFLPKDKADLARKSDDEIIQSKSVTRTEGRFDAKDGTHYFTINHFPLLNEEGNVYAVSSISTDITAIKRTEEQLREYKYFFDNSNDLCLIANGSGYFEAITPRVEDVLGYRDQEITKSPFIEFVHPDDIPVTLLHYEKLKAGATVINFVNRYRKKDGSYLWFDWNASANTTTGKLYCIARDITERKKLETQLKQFNLELEKRVEEKTKEVIEKEGQYRFLLENMREGIQVIGHDWKYIFVNNSVVHQGKYSNEELLGYTMMEKYPGIEQTELFKELKRCMQRRTASVFENEFQFPDGSKGWFELRIQPVPEGLFILSMDITDRKKAQQEKEHLLISLENKAAELQSSNIELERFAYIASHDLQEPLRMVSSFLGLLEEEMDGQLDATKKEYMHFAVDGAERMKELIQALLQYSRVGVNKEEFLAADLNDAAQYVSLVLEEDIKKNNAVLKWQPMPKMKVHKTLINQLFLNLVGNALKYRSEKNPEIEVGCNEKQEGYTFYVKDNGLGIEPKYYEKIFVIFKRLHNKSEYSGTGIGLAICKKIIELHNGKIWVESEAGKGSTFYFSIPKK